MGRSFLRLSRHEYKWQTTPRKLLEMIDAWKQVTKTQAYYFAMLNNGKEIPEPIKAGPAVEISADLFAAL